ncbi:hypothetical protein CVT24_010893 [Panaeolus cyanescens]|uniref:Uncharacterized protein n=1 Tax=Panaeolus cyanescens TaxID=181874 RepID=A0A409YVE8_9AGAR|nr:hypothetical protein CVT24_010893 [Panaeolus cyanescens]
MIALRSLKKNAIDAGLEGVAQCSLDRMDAQLDNVAQWSPQIKNLYSHPTRTFLDNESLTFTGLENFTVTWKTRPDEWMKGRTNDYLVTGSTEMDKAYFNEWKNARGADDDGNDERQRKRKKAS